MESRWDNDDHDDDIKTLLIGLYNTLYIYTVYYLGKMTTDKLS